LLNQFRQAEQRLVAGVVKGRVGHRQEIQVSVRCTSRACASAIRNIVSHSRCR
jgi:hypothetical protein